MENTLINKLDFPLRDIYQKYLLEHEERGTDVQPEERASHTYSLHLHYQNDLSAIENLGFRTSWSEMPGMANGYLDLANLEKIIEHPNVISLSYGSRSHEHLDHSVADINVRAATEEEVGENGVWYIHVDEEEVDLRRGGQYTGADVIIGIIDTGIDFTHPVFMAMDSSSLESETRILRIWDQGLAPEGDESGPDTNLLTVSNTYGVEYRKEQLLPIICRHRDCRGHGTHVAAIAAGNGDNGYWFGDEVEQMQLEMGHFEYVGVAPEAELVVVKYLDVPKAIRDTAGHVISDNTRFCDAVNYILKVGQAEGKPVVINCSLGFSLSPHDGLSEYEQYLDKIFEPDRPFYSGNIFVTSSGNNAVDHIYAKVTIPDSREIIVPFQLFDDRENRRGYRQCAWVDDTEDLFIDCWYREVRAPGDVSVAVRVPAESDFSDPIFAGELDRAFDRNKRCKLRHIAKSAVTRPAIGSDPEISIQRNNIQLEIIPNRRVNPAQHATGRYELKFSGPEGTVIHCWCWQGGNATGRYGFRVGLAAIIADPADAGDNFISVRDGSIFREDDEIIIRLPHCDFPTRITHIRPDSVESISGEEWCDRIEFEGGLPEEIPFVDVYFVHVALGTAITEDRYYTIGSPGGAKNVITVGACYDSGPISIRRCFGSFCTTNTESDHDRQDKIWSCSSLGPLVDYSGLGPIAPKPDFAAPGIQIVAAQSKDNEGRLLSMPPSSPEVLGDRFEEKTGTSMAAPHVAGIIALMLQKDGNLNVDQVRAKLRSSVRDGREPIPDHGDIYGFSFGAGIPEGVSALSD